MKLLGQVRSNLGMQVWFKIKKSVSIIHCINRPDIKSQLTAESVWEGTGSKAAETVSRGGAKWMRTLPSNSAVCVSAVTRPCDSGRGPEMELRAQGCPHRHTWLPVNKGTKPGHWRKRSLFNKWLFICNLTPYIPTNSNTL